MNWKKILSLLLIGMWVSGWLILFFMAGVVYEDLSETQDVLHEMCIYTNKLTNFTNEQSGLVEQCMGKPAFDMIRLDYFNCENIQG